MFGIGDLLDIGKTALGFIGAKKQQDLAEDYYEEQKKAAEANLKAWKAELNRQKSELPRIYGEERSAVIRQTQTELGRMSVAASEAGLSGSTFARMLNELSFIEGTDLAAIDYNEDQSEAAIDAAIVDAETGYRNEITTARNQMRAQSTNAWLGFAGSALQIGGDWYSRWREQQIARNTIG